MNKSEGKIVRIPDGKNFGFVRIGKQDYFFHREDFNGDWNYVSRSIKLDHIKVSCDIVDSPKGPRVSNVTIIS